MKRKMEVSFWLLGFKKFHKYCAVGVDLVLLAIPLIANYLIVLPLFPVNCNF